MALSGLPNDVLLCIAEFLPRMRDLRNLVRVNHSFKQLLTSLLYRQDARSGHNHALLWAARRGRPDTIQLALAEDANVGARDYSNKTALQLAVRFGHPDVVRILLNHPTLDLSRYRGYEPDFKPPDNFNLLSSRPFHHHCEFGPLSLAALRGYDDIVELLLPVYSLQEIAIEHSRVSGPSAFVAAARSGNIATLNRLLAVPELDPNGRDCALTTTPLLEACAQGHADVVEVLLADPRVSVTGTRLDDTPFAWAVASGDVDTVETLLLHARDKIVAHSLGATLPATESYAPLEMAAANDRVDVIKFLLQQPGVDINHRGVHGRTALFWAVLHSLEDTTLFLLENGANPDLVDKNSQTPLLRAIADQETSLAEILIEHGANLELPDVNGRTPLIMAVCSGAGYIAEVLLQKGANPNAHDLRGESALGLALSYNHSDIVELLVEAEHIDLTTVQCRHGNTPLFWATILGNPEPLEQLLATERLDINTRWEANGATPLITATVMRLKDMVQFLLQQDGIDVDARNNEGYTAQELAQAGGETELVELFLQYAERQKS